MFVCSKNCTFAKDKPFLAKEGSVYYFCISISIIVHIDPIKSEKNYFDIEGIKMCLHQKNYKHKAAYFTGNQVKFSTPSESPKA